MKMVTKLRCSLTWDYTYSVSSAENLFQQDLLKMVTEREKYAFRRF